MNKRGFTLIELLAVIVILAIIAVIAVPIVIDIIDKSKENATLQSAEMYMDAVELSIANRVMHHGAIPNKAYPIMNGGNICLETYELKEGKYVCSDNDNNPNNNELEVEVKGEAPKSGQIVIGNGEIEDATVKYSNDKTIVTNNKGEFIYPPTPKSFAEDDWETIVANVKAGNLSKYNVGDKKKIKLTSEDDSDGNADGITTGEYTIRIANTSNEGDVCEKEYLEKVDGTKEPYSKTACGFVIEFEDIITTHNMNPTGEYKGTQYNYGWNVDGWPASSMRTYVNNEVYNTLPEGLRNVIIPTTVVSGHGSTTGETNFVSEDKIYLLSTGEVWEQGIVYDTARELTRQLDYYKNYKNADGSIGVTTNNYAGAIKKFNGSASYWWLRSAGSFDTRYFYIVYNGGVWATHYAFNTTGVAVAFRLG